MSDIMGSAAKSLVTRATFRSQITPDYSYDPWAPSAPPSDGQAWLMNFVKPSVTLETAAGPIVIEPYGTPTENYGLPVAVGGVATIIGLVFMIGWIARLTKKG